MCNNGVYTPEATPIQRQSRLLGLRCNNQQKKTTRMGSSTRGFANKPTLTWHAPFRTLTKPLPLHEGLYMLGCSLNPSWALKGGHNRFDLHSTQESGRQMKTTWISKLRRQELLTSHRDACAIVHIVRIQESIVRLGNDKRHSKVHAFLAAIATFVHPKSLPRQQSC